MEDHAALLAWVRRELAFWTLHPVAPAHALARYAALNADLPGIFVFRFADGGVSLADKPDHLGRDRNPGLHERARLYLQFFTFVASLLPRGYEAILCANLDDVLLTHVDVPVFSFQKQWFRPYVLLPDIDFLKHDFYEDAGSTDIVAYDDKAIRAVFAGATSGRGIREEDVHRRELPRLRAAAYFWGNPDVDFRLPTIVQCNTPAAHAALAALPFCQPGEVGFQAQCRSRFMLSMDGNGATCSRVVLALRSNGVLLKYASDHILFYFHGLQPWLHYIPIDYDEDVLGLIRLERASPGLYRGVAEAGAHFAARYLTRDAVTFYMLHLLLQYPACLDGNIAVSTMADARPPPEPAALRRISAVAHVQDLGDLKTDAQGWVGRPGSGKWIEGFALSPCDGLADVHLVYQGAQASQVLTGDVGAGDYCGTQGHGLPLHGLCVRVTGSGAASIDLTYEASFIDGSRSGPVKAGTVCRSQSRAPLEAVRFIVREIGRAGTSQCLTANAPMPAI